MYLLYLILFNLKWAKWANFALILESVLKLIYVEDFFKSGQNLPSLPTLIFT